MSKCIPTVVGTWSFSADPVRLAGKLIASGSSCIESLEKAINGDRAISIIINIARDDSCKGKNINILSQLKLFVCICLWGRT